MQGSYFHCTQTSRVTITHQKLTCSNLAPTSEHLSEAYSYAGGPNLNQCRRADMNINCCSDAHGLFPDIQLLKVSTNSVREEATTTENLQG